MNRGNISDRVADYLDRTDLSTRINNWIDDTRVDLALKYSFRYLYQESTASTAAGTYRYALPSDYLGHLVIWVEQKKLMRVSQREFDELTDTDIGASAAPRHLTLEGSSGVTSESIQAAPDYYVERGMEFDLYPTPDAIYTITLRYYAQPTAATSDSYEDYMMRFHPDAVIWGASLRGAIYLDDEQKKANFANEYKNAVTELVRREKQMQVEDLHPRIKDSKDYDLTTFKRLIRFQA